MIENKGSVREQLKQLGGYKREIDPVDWLMGHDFGELKIGAKQGVATQIVLINQLNRLSKLGRAGRSGSSGGRALTPSITRGSKQALVKLIRKGGTQTARGLRDQMKYLNREGEVEVQRSERFFGVAIDDAEQDSLVASWGLDSPNSTGVDKTSHFVVSFPPGTDRSAAEKAGRDWAEALFDSGDYGDVFDYYTVQHNDTAHPHMHVVVNRRGVEDGNWLKISKRGPIDYQVLRDVQVDVAARHGIDLDATPRFARGETDRPHRDAEVKRAEREAREPERPAHTEQTATKAAVAVLSYAIQISGEADVYKNELPEISKIMKSISVGMREGISIEKMLQSIPVVDLGEAKHMSELLLESRDKVVNSFNQLDTAIQKLPANSLRRIEAERKISDNRSKAGLFIQEFREDKTSAERDGRYKGVSAVDDIGRNIKSEADQRVEEIARTSGLDPDKTLARYNSSRAATIDQSQRWLSEEIEQANIVGTSEAQVNAAHSEIKDVYDGARNQLRAHQDNKREIIRDLKTYTNESAKDEIQDRDLDRLHRIRNALTPQQRQKLERGDATQLVGISREPHTQKTIAHEYLRAAIDQASPEQRVQLEEARATVDRNLEQDRALQKHRELLAQRASRDRNSGLER